MRFLLIPPILLLIMSVFTQGCGEHNNLQTFPSDCINVYAPLKPNEEWCSGKHTYGEDSIIGNTITYKLSTDSIRIGVDIDFTILELHPRITANLISFIHKELYYPGLLEESDSIILSFIKEKLNNDYTQYEIASMFLKFEHNQFLSSYYQYTRDEDIYSYWITVHPVYLNEKYVTYKKYACAHREGAMTHESVYFQTFNRKSGEPIELNDILCEESIPKICERIANHMTGLDSVYSPESRISAVNNFPIIVPGIHDKGLIFTYEQYELTPGCYGCPVILLLYEEIEDYLKEPIDNYSDR